MDSSWFAVDADGHVALFNTDEGGALPTGAARGDHDEPLIAIYARECVRAFAASELDDERALDAGFTWGTEMVFVLDGAHPDALPWLACATLRRVSDDPPALIVTTGSDIAPLEHDALRGSEALRASFLLPSGGGLGDLEALGAYCYAYADTDDPGLYERVGATPARPRTVATMAGVPVFPLRQTRFARDIGLVEAKADERAARSMPPAGEFPAEDETLVDTTNAPAPADTVAKTG